MSQSGLEAQDELASAVSESGWWFGTFCFHFIWDVVLPIDFHIFKIQDGYPLVNCHITMENHHAINGTIHYFYGHFQ